jgi:hypothetical protein
VTDLATLSLAIDSRGMDAGLNKLDQFQSKAKETESAARNLQQQLDKAFRINVQGGGDRAADIAEYGRELDRLREKYVPLAALERQHAEALQEIAMAARVGAISEQERVAAIANVNKAFQNNATVMRAAGGTAKLTGDQFRMLGFQINDIVSGLAMGQSPFMVMTQQGGQVYQVLGQGPNGVGGSLKAIGSTLSAIITPARLAFGGLVAGAGAAALAVNSYLAEQAKLERALSTGASTRAGVTAGQFRQITDAAADAINISRSAASDMGLTFAATGRIGSEMFGELITQANRFARSFGLSTEDAAKEIAAAIANPDATRGLEMLEKRMGSFSGATYEAARNAMMMGDRIGAQRIVLQALADGPLVDSEKRIRSLGDAWEFATTKAGGYINAAIRSASEAIVQPIDKRIKELETNIEAWRKLSQTGANATRINNAEKELNDLRMKDAAQVVTAMKASETAIRNELTKTADVATRSILGLASQYDELIKKRAEIQSALDGAMDMGGMANAEQSAEAIRRINDELEKFGTVRNTVAIQASQTIAGLNEESNALETLNGSVRKRIMSSSEAAAALQYETQLQKLLTEAEASSGSTKEALIEKYNELTSAIERNNQARAAQQANQSIEALRNEAEVIRLRIGLAGEENGYIEKRIALLQVEQQIKAAGSSLSAEDADEWRRRAREVANLKEELDRLNKSSEDGVGSANKLATAWKGVGEAIQQAGYIMSSTNWQTGIDAMLGGGGGTRATGGSFAYYSSDFLSNAAYKANAAMNGTNGANDNGRRTELQGVISSLERAIERAQGRWDNYQPSAYAEKNPLLFYDFQSGDHFSAAEKAQIKKMEEQLEVARKQLAALERLEQQRQAVQSSGLPQNINRMEAMNFFQRDPRAFSQFYNMTSGGFGLRFATGGSFMVGGNGGTDTTPVSFMATKGERVTVETPAQQRSNATPPVVNDNRDQRTINLTVQVVADPNGGGDPKLAGDRMARDIAERLRRIA